jgi:predicted membrane chloride channel (bestrophin family)
MTRTLLFAFVYTIPFVFLGDTVGNVVYHCIAVFVMTYGYIGLEMVAIELDDPFGSDDNDLDA